MSFAEKIGSLMQRPNQDLVDKDDVPTWMKYSGRILGTFAGGVAIFSGLIACLTTDAVCILGALWQILAGFAAIVIEAPCCCIFLDHVQNISDKVDKRPYWNRAAFYMLAAVFPILFLCHGVSNIIGCGLIFGTGVLYGMMALGKKGTRADMAAVASPTSVVPPSNDHHSTLMEDPDVWRPT